MKKDEKYYYFSKGQKEFIGLHFNSSEFECHCNNSDCVDQKISIELVEKLDNMRKACGKAIKINSAYRCAKHNKAVGGKDNSSHMDGIAVDLYSPILRVDELVKLVDRFFDNVGINVIRNWCHVDIRPLNNGAKRRWFY